MIQINDLIGVPFVSRGRDPKTGLDCWGLVMEVSKRFGKNIPDFFVDAYDSKQIGVIHDFVKSDWVCIPTAEAGAVVGLKLDRVCMPDVVQHYGVCLDRKRFIHTLKDMGVIISRLDHRFFNKHIEGFYQWSL